MKTIEQVLNALDVWVWTDERKEVLREWAEEIITECAGNFECSMETDDYIDESGEEVKVTEPYPVLMRESINRVKSQIY